jgi:tetratricopeptide (TPR) repeat protein
MSFFKNLFGKNKKDEAQTPPKQELQKAEQSPAQEPLSDPIPPAAKEQLKEDIARFEAEIKNVFPRYFSNPTIGENLQINLKNAEGEAVQIHEAYPAQFEEWKGIQAPWDRMSLIFKILDQMFSQKLELWQAMNRFTEDRYPQRALELAEQHSTEADWENANYWYALGRAQFIMSKEDLAERSLLQCLEIEPSHKRGRIVYGDLLHETNRGQEAHKIYTEIIKESGIEGDGETPQRISMAELLGFKGIIHSPIYAIAILSGHEDTSEETWERASAAFYYSPHFRTRHAYHMIQQQQNAQALAKLYALSREMPWFQDAVINAYSIIEQLGLKDRMVEQRTWLKAVMDQNEWKI